MKNKNKSVAFYSLIWFNIIKSGGETMTISYKKLWKLLIDKDMKKCELQQIANISASSIAKLGKNENVNTDILVKICNALKCDLQDIMELIDNGEVKE